MKWEIIAVIILVVVAIFVGIHTFQNMNTVANTYCLCCAGQECDDVYYSENDKLCHFKLCERVGGNCTSKPMGNLANCTLNQLVN